MGGAPVHSTPISLTCNLREVEHFGLRDGGVYFVREYLRRLSYVRRGDFPKRPSNER
jgi:hypothetical protein